MVIEIVDLPIKKGDVPYSYVNVYQRVIQWKMLGVSFHFMGIHWKMHYQWENHKDRDIIG